MASLIIHDLDDAVTARLRVQADEHGWSVEDEARDILVAALRGGTGRAGGLAVSIQARFAALGGVEMPDVPREAMREPPTFEE